jgi:hypothetical protein
MTAAVAATGSFVGSVIPRSHQTIGIPNTTTLASENAKKTRVRMSRGARSQAMPPTIR